MTESCNEFACTICLLPYTTETRKTTDCIHTFHKECIDRWLLEKSSCPLCRTTIYIERPNTEQHQHSVSYNYTLGFGGIMALFAMGAQDLYLTDIPFNRPITSHISYNFPYLTVSFATYGNYGISLGAQDVALTAPLITETSVPLLQRSTRPPRISPNPPRIAKQQRMRLNNNNHIRNPIRHEQRQQQYRQ